jgi:hypothetical protein
VFVRRRKQGCKKPASDTEQGCQVFLRIRNRTAKKPVSGIEQGSRVFVRVRNRTAKNQQMAQNRAAEYMCV